MGDHFICGHQYKFGRFGEQYATNVLYMWMKEAGRQLHL